MTCVKLLMNTGCKRIVFLEEYVNLEAKNLWKGEWIYHGPIEHVYAEIGLVSAKRLSESRERKNHIIRLRDKRSIPDGTGSGGSQI
jgi:deoxycytidylate deaminase